MNKIIKLIAIFTVIFMLFSLCSCAKNADSEESAQVDKQVTEQKEEKPEDDKTEQKPQTDKDSDKETEKQEDSDTEENSEEEEKEPVEDEKNEEETEKTPDKPEEEDDLQNPDTPVTDDEAVQEEQENQEIQEEECDKMFDIYTSNVSAPTGNHYMLVSQTETTKTFRGIFPVEEYGKLEYSFYFSNNVDSTWGSGDVAYRDMPTESYEILSAAVMATKDNQASSVSRKTAITFDSSKTKTVEAYETFWSDPVSFNVSKGEYLVFEWKVKYTYIPCNKINGTAVGLESSNGITFDKSSEGIPMPNMIGAKREDSKANVVFIGDSITAGEQAGVYNGYVAQISNQLGEEYSVWNLGLGYARADDAVNSPSWLKKAKTGSTVCICFGVNDINSGSYDKGARTAQQVVDDISAIAKTVKEAGAHVVIFSTPPYTYADAQRVQKWKDVVKSLQQLANNQGYDYFDFASFLGTSADPSVPAYGGHPNGEGCTAAANGFIQAFKNGTVTLK